MTSFLGAFSALCITFSVVYSVFILHFFPSSFIYSSLLFFSLLFFFFCFFQAPYSEGLICGGVDFDDSNRINSNDVCKHFVVIVIIILNN